MPWRMKRCRKTITFISNMEIILKTSPTQRFRDFWRNRSFCRAPFYLPQSGPQPELDIWWRYSNVQQGFQIKGHDPGSLFSSLLRLEMTFSHSTLGAAPLNYEEARECEKKWQSMRFCVFSRGKTTENESVSAQRSTWRGAKHLKIEGVFQFFDLWKEYFWNLQKICLLMVVLLS